MGGVLLGLAVLLAATGLAPAQAQSVVEVTTAQGLADAIYAWCAAFSR